MYRLDSGSAVITADMARVVDWVLVTNRLDFISFVLNLAHSPGSAL